MSRPRQPRFTWRSAAFEPDSGLTWRARLAAAVYCEFANVNGALDPAPSIVTLAERMGVATTTAHAARRELEKTGWLSITRRPGRPSRIQLASFGEPLREAQGLGVPTPPRTPAPTPSRTPAPGVPEPGEPEEPEEPGDARAPARARDLALGADSKLPREPSATSAQTLVAAYVDRLRGEGIPAPRRLVGQVARQVGELARDGVPAEMIEQALRLMHDRRLNPATLPSLVPEAAAGPGKREHLADRLYREVREGQ